MDLLLTLYFFDGVLFLLNLSLLPSLISLGGFLLVEIFDGGNLGSYLKHLIFGDENVTFFCFDFEESQISKWCIKGFLPLLNVSLITVFGELILPRS